MRSHYKRIGDYVTQIKLKNSDDAISNLKGININKHFMPSVANINGTDLSKYRVVKKNQFAFNPMHVGRDEVLPISMLQSESSIIVSPAYVVFEVKSEEDLLPEYLMMWCRRSEFDRNAWFMTDNSVRGGFGWADFCDMELHLPSIEKQREIVREYNVVTDRITLNEQLSQKLEYTAQTIYKQWFIDFEFPITKEYADSIAKLELEGKPYKSSGGEMEYCEELEQDVPKGWKLVDIGQCCSKVIDNRGKTPPLSADGTKFLFETFLLDKAFPSIGAGSKYKYVEQDIYDSWFRAGHPTHLDLLVGTVGNGIPNWGLVPKGKDFCIAQNIVALRVLEEISPFYLNCFFNTHLFNTQFNARIKATAQPSIRVSDLKTINLLLPSDSIMSAFQSIVLPMFELMETKVMGNISLINLQDLLLKALAKKG
ncbi:restriction endonuclease subunit S [Colwellia piezophila]|uniref:restriction endonuclease subunit S n=1 Tax=Colwellia piezophila TaxID=211668 RepID=UPI0003605A2F|nr:restriction endonuclease subunit S [Colwellia piezophila]